MRAEYGKMQVSEKKRELMENRKLVLVLDLDNTLLHTELFDVGCWVTPKSSNGQEQKPKMIMCLPGCPIMKAMSRRK